MTAQPRRATEWARVRLAQTFGQGQAARQVCRSPAGSSCGALAATGGYVPRVRSAALKGRMLLTLLWGFVVRLSDLLLALLAVRRRCQGRHQQLSAAFQPRRSSGSAADCTGCVAAGGDLGRSATKHVRQAVASGSHGRLRGGHPGMAEPLMQHFTRKAAAETVLRIADPLHLPHLSSKQAARICRAAQSHPRPPRKRVPGHSSRRFLGGRLSAAWPAGEPSARWGMSTARCIISATFGGT